MKAIVIIPTYNERENIGDLLGRVFTYHPQISVMVVDDNSPDGTAEIVEECARMYPELYLHKRAGKLGLSTAYTDSFRKILTEMPHIEAIVTMDSDFSHNPVVIADLLEALKTHDMVIGSRYVRGGRLENWPVHRVLMSYCGNKYATAISQTGIQDLTAGFQAIKTSFLRNPAFEEIEASGFAFQMELKFIAHSLGGKIYEVPITFKNRVNGYSKISNGLLRYIYEGLVMPIKLRLRYRRQRRALAKLKAGR